MFKNEKYKYVWERGIFIVLKNIHKKLDRNLINLQVLYPYFDL